MRVEVEPSDSVETIAARALAFHRWGKRDKAREVAGQLMISFFEQTLASDLVDEVRSNPSW